MTELTYQKTSLHAITIIAQVVNDMSFNNEKLDLYMSNDKYNYILLEQLDLRPWTSEGPKGFKSAIVTTTHKGILDSEAQSDDRNNPVFHNHYVLLGHNNICHSDLAIVGITFLSPG